MSDPLMRDGRRHCRERRGLRQEKAILVSNYVDTRCKAWRDCCDDIMTSSQCCIEYLGSDGRKSGSGERCCIKNAMHFIWTAPTCLSLFSSFLFILFLIHREYINAQFSFC